MIICNNQQKRYNIIKLTELLHANDQSVSHFIGYNQKEEYQLGRFDTSLFGLVAKL